VPDNPLNPYSAPSVSQHAPAPKGVLPRHAQPWLIGGISLLMVLVIAFAGRSPKTRTASLSPTPSTTVDANDQRIQEYRARIEEQARKLAAEQALFSQVQQTSGQALGFGPDRSRSLGIAEPPSAGSLTAWDQEEPGGPPASQQDWIAADRAKRSYESLFSSSLALSYRDQSHPADRDGRDHDGTGGLRTPTSELSASDVAAGRALKSGENAIKTYQVFEGSILETVLTNRLDGTFSGPLNCMVTAAVYSRDGQHLLVPQGSRVLGEVKPVASLGQQRLAVMFHRLLMPDGFSVNLDALPGLNQIGETGLLDQVNHHYTQIFGVSLAIGAIAGLNQASTRYGSEATPADTYRQGVSSSLSQSSLSILDRYLNVLPTFTIREGHRVKVYLTGDLAVPAYDAHVLPSDL
jgi:type IV secretory pathway VirB10-like protein